MTLITLLLLAAVGLFAHWLKKYCRGQSRASFKEYMLRYKKQSIASATTALAAVATIYSTTESIDALTGQLAGLAFLAGYASDSVMNKGPGE